MRRALPYLALGLFLGLGVGFLVRLGNKPTYFCPAAEAPAAYQGRWFYRLEAGPEGWLLRHDDLATTFTLNRETLTYLVSLNKTLAAQSVTLIIAAQPPRGVALAADSLPEYAPGEALARYEAVRTTLQNAGLHVADLGEVVAKTPNYFFRRDHHWTPEGSRASAQAVAQTLTSTPEFRSATFEQREFKTKAVETEEQLGSFGEAIGQICGKNPPAEKLTRYRTTEVTAERGDLFGASAPPIVLAGTSNSAREDLNFAGFLAQASGLDVLNVSAIGGGPQAALGAYLRSQTFRESRPAFLVWEFATLFDVPQDPLFYRQLVPSVQGACSAAQSETLVTKQLSRSVLLFTGLQGKHMGFLYLVLSDLAQTSLTLKLSYEGGRVEKVTLEHSTRERNDGKFFLSLSQSLKAVTLVLPGEADGTVQARLCPEA